MAIERVLTTVIERPFESEVAPKARSMMDIFANLPLTERTNLDMLAPLAPKNLSDDELRRKINDRFLDLVNLRKGTGQYDIPKVDSRLAFALMDSVLYETVIEETKKEGRTLKVARHEQGHVLVAYSLGWHVTFVTSEPGSDYLGLTIVYPPAGKPLKDLLLERAAISFAGGIAAQMSQDEVTGTGADFSHARSLAKIAVALPDAPFFSEAEFLDSAQNLAHNALKSFGPSAINRQGLDLARRGTIT